MKCTENNGTPEAQPSIPEALPEPEQEEPEVAKELKVPTLG